MASDRPALRAADADRERTASALSHHAGAGRLTVEELDERSHAAYAAVTLADLDVLLADLPDEDGVGEERALPTLDAVPGAAVLREDFRSHLTTYLLVQVLLIGIWAATGADFFWPVFPALGWGLGVALDYAGTQRDLRRLRSATTPEERAAIVAARQAAGHHGHGSCGSRARPLPTLPRL